MIYAYFFWILLTGYAVTYLIFPRQDNYLERFAFTPFFGVLLPSLLIYALNLSKIPIHTVTLWVPWTIISFILIAVFFNSIVDTINKLIVFFKSLSLLQKFFFIIIILGMLGLYSRVAMNPIWRGDGFSHWGMKARYWYIHQSISFSDEEILYYKNWMNYPLYHSIGMLVHMVAVPFWPQTYSCHLNDAFYALGAWTTSLLFLKNIFPALSGISRLFWGTVIAFGSREMVGSIIASYAEIDVAYFLFLGVVSFLYIIDAKGRAKASEAKYFVALGIPFGTAIITRPDMGLKIGLIALVALFLELFTIISTRVTAKVKAKARANNLKLFYALIPLILLWIVDRVNRPDVSHLITPSNQFFDNIIWDPIYIITHFHKGFVAFYHCAAVPCESFYKCSFLIGLLVVLVGVFMALGLIKFKNDYKFNIQNFHSYVFCFLLGIVILNYLLCMVPIVAVNNYIDPGLDDPYIYATSSMGRYLTHVVFVFNALVVMIILPLWQSDS